MTVSCRLPRDLHAGVMALSERAGISFNWLTNCALNDLLDDPGRVAEWISEKVLDDDE